MTIVLIALGANLATERGTSPLETCEWAVKAILALERTTLIARSSWYRTAAIPPSDQPDYVNGVIAVQNDDAPKRILAALHAIEARAGRVRAARNAARVLDLDLLAAGDVIAAEPDLTLPHPRLAERAFVLRPLAEIAPDWRHPLLGETAAALAARVTDQAIERIESGSPILRVPSLWIT